MPTTLSTNMTHIGLTDTQREGVVSLLNAQLADHFLLRLKAKQFHWNVTGPNFGEYHAFFETLANDLSTIIDDVAERIRALGAFPQATMKDYLGVTRLEEETQAQLPASAMLEALLHDYEMLIRQLREDLVAASESFGDEGTTDFLTGLMKQHEKTAWMLRAYTS
ncbi:MAG: DNA starvation/stationary phase protection protein [Bacteroidetes bacterium]|nr:MAG: DNA starvation/stationary phase protection protein [Bacteroidota bacterium]